MLQVARKTSYLAPGRAEKIVMLTHSARSEGAANSEKHLFVYAAIYILAQRSGISPEPGGEKQKPPPIHQPIAGCGLRIWFLFNPQPAIFQYF
jgi:hypothetical protein